MSQMTEFFFQRPVILQINFSGLNADINIINFNNEIISKKKSYL